MSRPEVCVGAIAVDNDRLLLIRRGRGPAAGEWSVPGGRVEAGRDAGRGRGARAGRGDRARGVCDALVGWVERIGDDHHFVILDFAVTMLEPRPVAGDDAAEAAWVPLDEVADLRWSTAWPSSSTSTASSTSSPSALQRPFQAGGRFSMKARGPSAKSSVPASVAMAAKLIFQSVSSSLVSAARTILRLSRTASGALAQMRSARARAPSRAWPGSTSSLTSPKW